MSESVDKRLAQGHANKNAGSNCQQKVLDEALPQSYDREVYSTKCDVVFDHFFMMAQNGNAKAYA